MATNNEIIEKYDLEGDGDLGIDVNEALKEARSDTTKQLLAKLQKCIYYSESHDGYIHMDWKQLKETFPELNLQKVD